MRIFVVGNINSGKSHIVNKLIKKYPSYNILSIDEFRKNILMVLLRKRFKQEIFLLMR